MVSLQRTGIAALQWLIFDFTV